MKEYELTEAQLEKILDAGKPVRCMLIGSVAPRSPQENANSAWRSLADELGFVWDTVRPVPGKGQRFVAAEEKPITPAPAGD